MFKAQPLGPTDLMGGGKVVWCGGKHSGAQGLKLFGRLGRTLGVLRQREGSREWRRLRVQSGVLGGGGGALGGPRSQADTSSSELGVGGQETMRELQVNEGPEGGGVSFPQWRRS